MLAGFPSALRRAKEYELQNFHNTEGRTILRVKGLVEEIQRALTNLTGLTVNETSGMTRSELESCGISVAEAVPEEEEEEEEGSEVRTGQQTLRTSDSVVPSESSGTEENTGSQTLRSVSPVCFF